MEPPNDAAPALAPFRLINQGSTTPILVICDHASHVVPRSLGTLGLPPFELVRHIGWDIGAAEIAELLAARLGASAVLSGASRLVADCNRYARDPSCIAEISDGTSIPGNIGLSPEAKRQRLARWHAPYHAAITGLIEKRIATGISPVIVSIHSMTDRMQGQFRPWQIALSSNVDRRLTDPVLAALREGSELTIGDNEPYNLAPDEDYSTTTHALARGLHHVQVEFRQDLVDTTEGALQYGEIFLNALIQGLASIGRDARGHHA